MDLDIIHEYSTIAGNSYIEGRDDVYYTGALGYYEKDTNENNIFVDYVNGNYVPSSLQSSDGVSLIKHLRSYIEKSTRSSVTGDVYLGIISYCSSRGIAHNGGYALADISYVVGRIDTYETPFILGLHNHPKYKNHWVTGYGYRISGGSNFAIVNDGWGETEVSINLINCDYIIW